MKPRTALLSNTCPDCDAEGLPRANGLARCPDCGTYYDDLGAAPREKPRSPRKMRRERED